MKTSIDIRHACAALRPAAAGGGGALAAFGPAVVLAARNAAYGLSLAPILRGRLPQRALAAQLVIDETTAMARAQDEPAAARCR